jgi:uncharacterized protein YjhX (UPF0386 family)
MYTKHLMKHLVHICKYNDIYLFQNGKQVKVIPSLDGGLYQINGEKIEVIQYTCYGRASLSV